MLEPVLGLLVYLGIVLGIGYLVIWYLGTNPVPKDPPPQVTTPHVSGWFMVGFVAFVLIFPLFGYVLRALYFWVF
jgi:hypothetical protein